ncbi:MAG: hypothetical protein ACKVOE_07485 [Rickettsiales bacterium]
MSRQQVAADIAEAGDDDLMPTQGNWAKKASPKLTFEAYREANLALIEAGGNPPELVGGLFQPLTNYKYLMVNPPRPLKPIVTLNDANEALDTLISDLEAGIARNDSAYRLSKGVPELLKIFKEAMNKAMKVSPSRA